jgi:ABC-type lipopolysaccharide export system ATPase subunit
MSEQTCFRRIIRSKAPITKRNRLGVVALSQEVEIRRMVAIKTNKNKAKNPKRN